MGRQWNVQDADMEEFGFCDGSQTNQAFVANGTNFTISYVITETNKSSINGINITNPLTRQLDCQARESKPA
jgi:hypothetical protein